MRIHYSIPVQMFGVTLVTMLVGLFGFTGQSHAQENEIAGLQQWILDLADPVPAVRNKAEFEILAVGEDALPDLNEGLQNSNLEIHNRCRVLIESLEARRKARLSKIFLAADSGGEEVRKEFPAWASFRDFVGEDELLTRKLFLKMCDDIPLVFENYDFRIEQNNQSLKQSARLVLVKAKHPSASVESLLTAYLYLANRGSRLSEQSRSPLFNSVEVLEGLNFVSNPEHAQIIRRSDFRRVVDAVTAKWVLSNNEVLSVTSETMFNLVYQTSNPQLIDELARKYDRFDTSQKLSFLDIVARATEGKHGVSIDRSIVWLEKALEDDTTIVNSRYQKRPAEKIQVTPKLLAQSTLAELFNRDVENGEPFELKKIFGIYPRSRKGFLIIESEKERQLLSDKLRVRMQRSESVE